METERVGVVVLAAGNATRFGGGKLLATIDGRPVLQHVLDRVADAGLTEVIVVVGREAAELETAIEWRAERRIRNPDPSQGLSSSLRIGVQALPASVDAALVVLGDQPRVSTEAITALLTAGVDADRPFAAPLYRADAGRNPVLIGRDAFELVGEATGDRGLGPFIATRSDLVRDVPIDDVEANPDLDTRADHVALVEAAWAARVRENAAQVDRHREVPDGTDFYAPVTGLFRADPTRTDEPALAALLALVRPGERWLDIGAGAGRYALPIARALAPSGGAVIALDASAGMLTALGELATEHAISNVTVIQDRWPPDDLAAVTADVALIAHVGYDIEAIGPFLEAMEVAAARLCIAVLMERQPSSIADVCWPPVHGESRVSLPALPEFVELLRALGRDPAIEWLERAPRRFSSRDELAGFLRRQLWIEEGSAADARFLAALDENIDVDPDGLVGLVDQRPLPIGIVTWVPGPDR